MSDPNDDATEIEIAERHNAIQAAILGNQPQTHPDFDGEHCVECGDAIPKVRLLMCRIRCVHCQTVHENKGKYFR